MPSNHFVTAASIQDERCPPPPLLPNQPKLDTHCKQCRATEVVKIFVLESYSVRLSFQRPKPLQEAVNGPELYTQSHSSENINIGQRKKLGLTNATQANSKKTQRKYKFVKITGLISS